MRTSVWILISIDLLLSGVALGNDKSGTERSSMHFIRISSDDVEAEIHRTDGSSFKRYVLNHSDESASFLSLHFDTFDFDPHCRMEISGGKEGSSSIHLMGRGRNDLGTFWSHHINDTSAILTIECTEWDDLETTKTEFAIDRYLAGYTTSRSETRNDRQLGVCRNDDRENVQCYEASHPEAFAAANSIVRIQYDSDVCTGWMISPRLLMTAGHCVGTEEQAINTQYRFNYASTSCDADVFGEVETIDSIEMVEFNKEADYTIVKMDGYPGYKYGYLEIDNILPSLGDPIYIPQHPSGRDKELAIFDSSIFARNAGGLCHIWTTGEADSDKTCGYGGNFTDFTYICDTEGGSSGAPVISANTNKVIGLHHCGGGCGDNFAIPFVYVYNDVMAIVNEDISAAELDYTTMAPSSHSETVAGTTWIELITCLLFFSHTHILFWSLCL
eukprot:scaffold22714_cov155-Cylindrotheca_fusiformis.AAC.3